VALSCSQRETDWRGTIEERGGVIIVKNPKEPLYDNQKISFEENLLLGDSKQGDEYLFNVVVYVVVDDRGRIYVADSNENHIKIFDKEGKYLKTFGRKGQAPGEFDYIYKLQISPQKELVVYDGYRKSLSFFTLEGHFIRSISILKSHPYNFRVDSKNNIYIHSIYMNMDSKTEIHAISFYDSDMNFVTEVAKTAPRDWSIPFLPGIWWTLDDRDNLLYGFNKSYELLLLGPDGKLKMKIAKDFEPVEVPKEEREKRIKNMRIEKVKNIPRIYPAYNWFIFDDEGRVIIKTWKRGEKDNEFFYDIFSSEGKYIFNILLKGRPIVWKNNNLYSIEEDEEGYDVVKRYKITWNY